MMALHKIAEWEARAHEEGLVYIPVLCETARRAIELLQEATSGYSKCSCSEAYTDRGMTDPMCGYHANEKAMSFLDQVTKETPK